MSADTKSRKRKSGDDVVPSAKKVKTATSTRSADKPAPMKSALKKSVTETVMTAKPKSKKSKGKKEHVKDTVIEEEEVENVISDAETPAEKPQAKKSKSKKEVVKEPIVEEEESDPVISDAEESGADLTQDQTNALLAGFSSDEDSAEEDNDEGGLDISQLPIAPKTSKALKKAAKENDPESTPGVIYISRLPHGFFEKQLRGYFSQFGEITNLRLARNKKTGKSKHYAFIEFASAAVADIVAKTMDKYLLFGHILQVRRVPQEQVKESMWRGIKGGRARPRNRIEGTKLRKGMGRDAWERRVEREEQRRAEKKAKLAEMGYEFDTPALKSVGDVPVTEPVVALDDGEEIKLLEGKKTETDNKVEEVEKVIKAPVDADKITEEKTIKRKNKETGATSTTKKRKTKAV